MKIVQWAPKDPLAVFAVAFDFSRDLNALDAAQVMVKVRIGSDSNPENILLGPPEIVGTQVRQRVKEGLHRNVYLFTCVGSDALETHVAKALLPVVNQE